MATLTIQQAFDAELAPFQQLKYTFDNCEPLGCILPAGHWHHDIHGSVFIPTCALYTINGKTFMCAD